MDEHEGEGGCENALQDIITSSRPSYCASLVSFKAHQYTATPIYPIQPLGDYGPKIALKFRSTKI